MKKINVAIIGYGNIGQYALEAVLASPDMSLAGIVRRDTTTKIIGLENYKVVSDINKLDDSDLLRDIQGLITSRIYGTPISLEIPRGVNSDILIDKLELDKDIFVINKRYIKVSDYKELVESLKGFSPMENNKKNKIRIQR